MTFYTTRHQYYCGVDLHARSLYVCILDRNGKILRHRKIPADPKRFLAFVEPYREDLIVGAECVFCWYWLADVCQDNGIPFVLGHALYMKAIHGGKAKNDRIDSKKIAHLLLGCMFPQAYVYPRRMRATRDLLRRRLYFVHHRAEMMAHIRDTASQYNLPDVAGRLDRPGRWEEISEHFPEGPVRESVQANLTTIEHLSGVIAHLEWYTPVARDHTGGHDADMPAARPVDSAIRPAPSTHRTVDVTRVGTCSAPSPIPTTNWTGRRWHDRRPRRFQHEPVRFE